MFSPSVLARAGASGPWLLSALPQITRIGRFGAPSGEAAPLQPGEGHGHTEERQAGGHHCDTGPRH